MNFRLSAYCAAMLAASALFTAPQVMAADNGDGIVVYNAQHENLVKSWVDGFTKEPVLKSRCATATIANWVINWCRRGQPRRRMSS